MEEENLQHALAVATPRPSSPMENSQSRASPPRADAAPVTMGRTIFQSTVDRTKGVVMANAFAGRRMSIIGGIYLKEFHMHEFFDTSYQDDYTDCLRRLDPTTSAKDLTTHLKKMEQYIYGTCDWFLDLDQYRSWHHGQDGSILLLLGNMGMGKTMMCNFVKENLEKSASQQGRQKTIVCTFCDYHPERSTATAVLARLLLELLKAHEPNFHHIRNDYLQYIETLPDSIDNLWAIFYKFLKTLSGEVYLIIDGMDKCDEFSRQDLFMVLITSLRITGLTIKILLTSRSESDFLNIPNRSILKVEQRDVSEHLRTSVSEFIQARVNALPVASEMKENIHRKICKKAGETYLWASFVVQDLEQARDDEEIDIKLENLPRDLHEVYDRMLRDVDPAKTKEAAFVLRMAVLARRPLRPEELGVLYALHLVRRNPPNVQTLKQVKPYKDLHTACKSLVNIDSSGAVSFVHQSVKDHLLDRRFSINYWSSNSLICRIFPGLEKNGIYMLFASAVSKALGTLGLMRGISLYHVVPDETHLLLLKICWTCFGTEEFQQGKKIIQRNEDDELFPNPHLQEVLESRPEFNYMVKEWQTHALAAGQVLSTCQPWLAENLNKLPNLRDVWLHHVVLAGDVNAARLLLDNHADVKTRWGDYGSILHGPSSTGNEEMVKLLIDHKADMDAKGRLFDNALEAASSNDRTRIVKMLLEHGATVNAQDGDSCSALQTAVAHCHMEIVHTLLRYGANVNSCGGRHASPLQVAARYGYDELVQLLLDYRANVNAQGQGHAYALQAASCCGHLETVKLLVEHGADINATGGTHGSALDAAADGDNGEVKKWLIECGAKSSRKKEQGDNQLFMAAQMGQVEKVETLLNNYDINTQCGKSGSPLHAAAYKGYERVVQLLIDSGADINAQGGRLGFPLQAAAHGGHENIVRLLINNGADVNAQGGTHGNALHAASTNRHVEIMRVLLKHGVSANIRGEEHGTALHAAIFGKCYNRKEACQLLLENGALANVQGGLFGTPLVSAALDGDIDIAELLFDYGANVNANGGHCGSALQAAALCGKKEMVKWLLDRGALVNDEGGVFGFALQAASSAGERETVELLLDRGALVNAKGGFFGSALQAAACEGNKEVVDLLLDRGANVNAEGGAYGTALDAARCDEHEDIVQLLQKRGARLDRRGSWGIQAGKVGVYNEAADLTSSTSPSSGMITSLAEMLSSFWRRLNGISIEIV